MEIKENQLHLNNKYCLMILAQIPQSVWIISGIIVFLLLGRIIVTKAAKSFYGNIIRRIQNDPSTLDILIDPNNPNKENIIQEFAEIQALKKIIPKKSSIPGTQSIQVLTTSKDQGKNWYELIVELKGTQQKIISMKKIIRPL